MNRSRWNVATRAFALGVVLALPSGVSAEDKPFIVEGLLPMPKSWVGMLWTLTDNGAFGNGRKGYAKLRPEGGTMRMPGFTWECTYSPVEEVASYPMEGRKVPSGETVRVTCRTPSGATVAASAMCFRVENEIGSMSLTLGEPGATDTWSVYVTCTYKTKRQKYPSR